jgi:hypothetical protein
MEKIYERTLNQTGLKFTKYESGRWKINITEDLINGIKTINIKDNDMIIDDISALYPYQRLSFSFISSIVSSVEIDTYIQTLKDLKDLDMMLKEI